MKNPNLVAEISALEEQLNTYKNLLERAISDNVVFAKTRVIFHHVTEISNKLEEIKKGVQQLLRG